MLHTNESDGLYQAFLKYARRPQFPQKFIKISTPMQNHQQFLSRGGNNPLIKAKVGREP